MRKYQSVGVFKSTSLKAIKRRKNSGITAKDLERAVDCGELSEVNFPHFTKEQILEIEKHLDDTFRKVFHIIGCDRTVEVEDLRSIK